MIRMSWDPNDPLFKEVRGYLGRLREIEAEAQRKLDLLKMAKRGIFWELHPHVKDWKNIKEFVHVLADDLQGILYPPEPVHVHIEVSDD